MMHKNFANFIAEDIERFNALLNQSTNRTSNRSNVTRCYSSFILVVGWMLGSQLPFVGSDDEKQQRVPNRNEQVSISEGLH